MEGQKESLSAASIKAEASNKQCHASSQLIAKKIFSPVSKSRTKRLIEKVLEFQKTRHSSDANVPISSADLNDSSDFKDIPKLRKPPSRLKLKSSSSFEKGKKCKDENSASSVHSDGKELNSVPASLLVFAPTAPEEEENSKNLGSEVKSEFLCGSEANYDLEGLSVDKVNQPSDKRGEDIAKDFSKPQAPGSSKEPSGVSSIVCAICGCCVDKTRYEEHRRTCLRDRFAKQSGKLDPSTSTDEERKCHVCHKIISNMNVRLQGQHINNCLDKVEKEKQREEEHKQQLLLAREAILGCPLCHKNFKTMQGRKGHLKKCAKDNSMTVDRLKLLMKQQEEDYSAKLEAGILPEEFKSVKKKSNAVSKRKKADPLKTSLEEATQLALALSNSLLAADDGRPHADFTQPVVVARPPSSSAGADMVPDQVQGPPSVHALLSDSGKAAPRGRKGKQTEATSVLFTLSKEQAADRISSRVDSYIFSNIQGKSQVKTPPFKTASKLLEGSSHVPTSSGEATCEVRAMTSSGSASRKSLLWHKTSFEEQGTRQQQQVSHSKGSSSSLEAAGQCSDAAGEEPPLATTAADGGVEEYYVTQLMPPVTVSGVTAGSKVRRVSAIPGRRKSGDVVGTIASSSSDGAPDPGGRLSVAVAENLVCSDLPSSQVSPSQTVQDLALLAMESDHVAVAPTATSSVTIPETSGVLEGEAADFLEDSNSEESLDTRGVSPDKPPVAKALDGPVEGGTCNDGVELASLGSNLHNKEGTSPQRRKTASFADLVNSSLYSDISILVSDSPADRTRHGASGCSTKTIRAHRVILHVQCPALLAVCETRDDGDQIDLSEFEEPAVLTMLRFVYSGEEVTCELRYRTQILQLAHRFSLPELSRTVHADLEDRLSPTHMDTSEPDPATEGRNQNADFSESDAGSASLGTTATVAAAAEKGGHSDARPEQSHNSPATGDSSHGPGLEQNQQTGDCRGTGKAGRRAPSLTGVLDELAHEIKVAIKDSIAVRMEQSGLCAAEGNVMDGSVKEEEKDLFFKDEAKPNFLFPDHSMEVKKEELPEGGGNDTFIDGIIADVEAGTHVKNGYPFADVKEEEPGPDVRSSSVNPSEVGEPSFVHNESFLDATGHGNPLENVVPASEVPPATTKPAASSAVTKRKFGKRVTVKEFKRAVQSVALSGQPSASEHEASAEDESFTKIIAKIETTTSLDPNDPVYIPSVLHDAPTSSDELSITHADIKTPREKKKRKTPRESKKVAPTNQAVSVSSKARVLPPPFASGSGSPLDVSSPSVTAHSPSVVTLHSASSKHSKPVLASPPPENVQTTPSAVASLSSRGLGNTTGSGTRFTQLKKTQHPDSPDYHASSPSPKSNGYVSDKDLFSDDESLCGSPKISTPLKPLTSSTQSTSPILKGQGVKTFTKNSSFYTSSPGACESSVVSSQATAKKLKRTPHQSHETMSKVLSKSFSTTNQNNRTVRRHCSTPSPVKEAQVSNASNSPPCSQASLTSQSAKKTRRGLAKKDSPIFKLSSMLHNHKGTGLEFAHNSESENAEELSNSRNRNCPVLEDSPQVLDHHKESPGAREMEAGPILDQSGNNSCIVLEESPFTQDNLNESSGAREEKAVSSPHNRGPQPEKTLLCRKSLDFDTSLVGQLTSGIKPASGVTQLSLKDDGGSLPASKLSPVMTQPKKAGHVIFKKVVESSPLPLRQRLQMKVPFGKSVSSSPPIPSGMPNSKSYDSTEDSSQPSQKMAHVQKPGRIPILSDKNNKGNPSLLKEVKFSDVNKSIDPLIEFDVGDDDDDDNLYLLEEAMRCEKKLTQSVPSTTTPVHQTKSGPTRQWKEPSPFTPMAPYDSMDTPQLKKAVQNIGVRPIGKKRMRELLKEVYHQTHQYETDSEYEGTPVKCPRAETQLSREEDFQGGGALAASHAGRDKSLKPRVIAASQSARSATEDMVGAHSASGRVVEGSRIVEASGNVDDDNDELPQSQDSSCSDGPDLPEESILQGWPEEELASTQMTQTTAEVLTDKLMQFINSNQDIHEDILLYKPLELDVLKKRITEAGIKVAMAKLMDFLDERCITFTMKNMSTRNNRCQKQPKKKDTAAAKQKGQKGK